MGAAESTIASGEAVDHVAHDDVASCDDPADDISLPPSPPVSSMRGMQQKENEEAQASAPSPGARRVAPVTEVSSYRARLDSRTLHQYPAIPLTS